MSEMAGNEGQGSETGQEDTSVADESQGGSGLNPAWNDLMGIIPSQLHSQVTPHLSQWDKNYQDGIQKVHSQYEPYKEYLDNEIGPDSINYALQIAQALEERPDEFFRALGEHQGFDFKPYDEQQGQNDNQQQEQGETPPEFLQHPEFVRLKEMAELMAQTLVQQNEQSQDSQEDQALTADLDAAHEEHGDFDEEWVLTKVFNSLSNGKNMTIDEAVRAFADFKTGILQEARKPGPQVLKGGGQAPNSQVDPKSLDGKGRRDLMVQMLERSHQQEG